MLLVKEEVRHTIGFGFSMRKEKSVRCEECYCPIPIYSYMARRCPHCEAFIPNALHIADNLDARIKYHYGIGHAYSRGVSAC